MFEEDLSPALQRALAAADFAARRAGAPAIGELHLLAGLLADGESQAARLLYRFGGRLPAVADDAASGGVQDAANPLPFDQKTREILRLARECVGSGGGFEPTGSEDVLVVMLEVHGAAGRQIVAHGVDRAALLADYAARRPSVLALPAGDIDFNPKRSGEETDVARIIDANANRAREGMRAVEDFARFARDDAALAQRLKDCRHQLRHALERLPFRTLAAARDVGADVGTSIVAADENFREGLASVVVANCKRAQEAVRVMEEYAKIESPDAAARFERIRYEMYAIERLLAIGIRAAERLGDARLYWLADPERTRGDFAWTVERALAGGVDVVQLRAKGLTDVELLDRAQWLRRQTRTAKAIFIVNDRPDIARLCEADGVHLGQDDLPIAAARKIVGPEALIGVSTHSIEQARRAVAQAADYIGVGPVFPSHTKSFDDFVGLGLVRQAVAEIRIPVYPIGGIDAAKLPDLVATGASRAAVSNAIGNAEDPAAAARRMADALAKAAARA